MLDPHDDTDVPSGSTDGAQMESTSSPVPRLHPLPGMGRLEGDGAVIGRKYAPVAMMECSERQEDATNLRRLGQRYCVPSFGAPGSWCRY